jgi:hypothetical protein
MARPALNPGTEDPGVAHRTAAVRAAKVRKARLGLGSDLTPDELDAFLPPIDCHRTRLRLARERTCTSCDGSGFLPGDGSDDEESDP